MTRKRKPKFKQPKDLTRKQLEDLAGNIQAILYLDMEPEGDTWDPEKEWDEETIEMVASILNKHGMIPPEKIPAY